MGVNANGISSKHESLQHIVNELNPSVIFLQETKLKKAGKLKYPNYIAIELVRKNSAGGGLATLVKSDLNPVWISEGDDMVEILVVEIRVNDLPIRIINCYGPQECDSQERKSLFWTRLHTEVVEAVDADTAFIVLMDGDLHAGSEIVEGDPNPINANGRLFSTFLKNNPIISLINGSENCEGLLTRKRMKGGKTEEAILDFILVCDKLLPYVQKMVIDEAREYALSSYNNQGNPKHSDHFTEIIDFNISYRRQKPTREENFKFKDTEGQKLFSEILNNESNLVKCFQNNEDIDTQTNNWLKQLNNIFHRCFKKVRVVHKVKETDSSKLLSKRIIIIIIIRYIFNQR